LKIISKAFFYHGVGHISVYYVENFQQKKLDISTGMHDWRSLKLQKSDILKYFLISKKRK